MIRIAITALNIKQLHTDDEDDNNINSNNNNNNANNNNNNTNNNSNNTNNNNNNFNNNDNNYTNDNNNNNKNDNNSNNNNSNSNSSNYNTKIYANLVLTRHNLYLTVFSEKVTQNLIKKSVNDKTLSVISIPSVKILVM